MSSMKREPTAEERENIGSAIGDCKAGGRGGWREVLVIVGRLSVVAIFGCHL
jgi:hypothetical protein